MVRITVLIAAVSLFALTACTAITDFDMPTGGLYDLNANIPADIAVTLAGDGTGSLVLNLTEPLPTASDAADQAAMDQEMLALLTDGTINITVQNAVPVSFLLTSGAQVAAGTVPAAAGQYTLALDTTRAVLTIQFYNETTTGSTLNAGETYTALFDVLPDNGFFMDTVTSGSITRTVSVN
jgi:hypothetical protein